MFVPCTFVRKMMHTYVDGCTTDCPISLPFYKICKKHHWAYSEMLWEVSIIGWWFQNMLVHAASV